MIINIIQVILILLIFIITRYLTYKITEEWGLPKWLQYKPFICEVCLTFWSLLGIYISIGLIFGLWITLIGGIILAILNAIAMKVHQKNNTVKVF